MDALTWAVVASIAAAAAGAVTLVTFRHRIAVWVARRRSARYADREAARRKAELQRAIDNLSTAFAELGDALGVTLARQAEEAATAIRAFADAMKATEVVHDPRTSAHREPPRQKLPGRREVARQRDHARRRGA